MKLKRRLIKGIKNFLIKKKLPKVYNDHYECLFKGGSTFEVDINKCVDPRGLNYGNEGWQYLSAGARSYLDTRDLNLLSDSFAHYFNHIKGLNALEYFIVKLETPQVLKSKRSNGARYYIPWSDVPPDEVISKTKSVYEGEKLKRPNSNVDNVLDDVQWMAKNHSKRLTNTIKSIKEKGYDRKISGDDLKGFVLVRNNDYRICIFGGQHRLATLSALKYDSVPVEFRRQIIITESNVDEWPLVKSGFWSKEDALKYFNHLFDFNSRIWAKSNDLL